MTCSRKDKSLKARGHIEEFLKTVEGNNKTIICEIRLRIQTFLLEKVGIESKKKVIRKVAFLQFKNVQIVGVSAGVPKNVVDNEKGEGLSSQYDAADFIETTGVRRRRYSPDFTTSDLCFPAAEKLIADLKWDKKEIDAIIFVSQTADYIEPATACILQDKLGLSRECYALDVSLGCSGWVYGLSVVAGLLNTGSIRKALLLAGDARSRVPSIKPLFGYAGTVTAVEYSEGAEGFQFHFGTDGSGYDAIIIPDGGARNQITLQGFELEEIEGKTYNRFQSRMKGMDVFSFGISTAPKSIKKLISQYDLNLDDYEYVVFHQANMKMNEVIRKKLKLSEERVPYSMPEFGNTSSASIPLTIVTQLRGKLTPKTKIIGCGFGVGLSWGTVAFNASNVFLSDLVEVE